MRDKAASHIPSAVTAEACSDAQAMRQYVFETFAGYVEGTVIALPKQGMEIGAGRLFETMMAADIANDLAVAKLVGVGPDPQSGQTTIHTTVMVSSCTTGELLATLDGTDVTIARTAAFSAIAAQYLARPDSRRISFVGCGKQARSHLAALKLVLPHLDEVVAYSRTRATAERFASYADGMGLRASVVEQPRLAVEAGDVIMTAVPISGTPEPFLDARWVSPGAFVTSVDLGRSWKQDGLDQFDLVATDELKQSSGMLEKGKLKAPAPFAGDLAAMTQRETPLRENDEQKALFVFAGHSLGDLAGARLVYDFVRRGASGSAGA